MKSPLIDVLLATHNGSKHLESQLDSILTQTHQNFRILVSDDRSSDDTLAILSRYKNVLGDKLVLLPPRSTGRGVVGNFEYLANASLQDDLAPWMAFCDQDDVWLPNKIERSLKEMIEIEGGAGSHVPCLVYSDLKVVDDKLQVIAPSFAEYQMFRPVKGSTFSQLSLNQVTGCSMTMNRALLAMAVPFPDEAIMHDWWCSLMGAPGRQSFVAQPLVLYRQHGANQIGAKDRRLISRLRRLVMDGSGLLQRVQALGRETFAQAQALQKRLRALGLPDEDVANYLRWRQRPWWVRLVSYRKYYSGPELDRLSRCLLWSR